MKPDAEHEHVWVAQDEKVEPERSVQQIMAGMPYRQGRATLRVKICTVCNQRRYLKLTVEPT